MTAVSFAEFLHHFRVSDGGSADDHSVSPGRQPCFCGGQRANAATHLHRYSQGANDGGDDLQVGWLAAGRAVEIDQVQTACSLLLPSACGG